ncbi:Uncharacterised protein [Shigella sonnei]|nr:Uncharacterised protein [Shigella sonnei]CSS28010.1 Uncharacterised protein [Shigella sonnei]
MARFFFRQNVEGDFLRIKQIKSISAPQFPFLLHTPGDNMLFCQPTADGDECFHCCSLLYCGPDLNMRRRR